MKQSPGLLLDTHALLWWLLDDEQLSAEARQAIQNPQRSVHVSAATAWELSAKWRRGKLPQAEDIVRRLMPQARTEKLVLVSCDPVFKDYGVTVCW